MAATIKTQEEIEKILSVSCFFIATNSKKWSNMPPQNLVLWNNRSKAKLYIYKNTHTSTLTPGCSCLQIA